MKTTCPSLCVVVSGLALAGILAATPKALAAEELLVVKISDMTKAADYKIMSGEEFKELEGQIQLEARVFQKAVELVKKEWKADEGNKNSPFPGGRLNPRKAEVVERAINREKAEKKLESLSGAESKRKFEPKKLSSKMTEAEKKQEEARADRERDLQKSADLIKTKIDELAAKEKEAKQKTEVKPAP